MGIDESNDERSFLNDAISSEPLLGSNFSDDLNNNRSKKATSNYLNQLISDRFYFVYIIMIFFGIGCLLPWNVFITAKSVIFFNKIKCFNYFFKVFY